MLTFNPSLFSFQSRGPHIYSRLSQVAYDIDHRQTLPNLTPLYANYNADKYYCYLRALLGNVLPINIKGLGRHVAAPICTCSYTNVPCLNRVLALTFFPMISHSYQGIHDAEGRLSGRVHLKHINPEPGNVVRCHRRHPKEPYNERYYKIHV